MACSMWLFSQCVMCRLLCVLCTDWCLYYIQIQTCLMCRLEYVLWTGFSTLCEQFAATNLVASRRACLASLGREGPSKGPREGNTQQKMTDRVCCGSTQRGLPGYPHPRWPSELPWYIPNLDLFGLDWPDFDT